jgi:hypothetical protein
MLLDCSQLRSFNAKQRKENILLITLQIVIAEDVSVIFIEDFATQKSRRKWLGLTKI